MEALIRERFEQVLEKMAKAAQSVGRNPEEVQLVVVTKTHPPETVYAALAAGARLLGENYAEEGVEKMQTLAAMGVNLTSVKWHMIGHVQSRKAGLIAQYFDLLHSLDSVKLAQRLNQFAGEHHRTVPAFLQLNVSGEGSKSGLPAWDDSHQNSLLEAVTEILNCPHLHLQGLMTLPPFFDDPEAARAYFRKLRGWRDFFARRFPQAGWDHLSMGMSGDFEVAIQEGATLVRVGTAILGVRA
ncbi:MAG: YggS family pyridoxal phosphate-dependent enzyme [Anaerolineales bacterium]|nr:YggS family pyridoxal phosphate-dependent enzyme [Anaerolineales bacterium]